MKKKLCIWLTLTALVLTFCGVSAWADIEGKMHWSYPQTDDDMIYHWEMEKNVGEVDFSDVAMYLEFDVSDSGRQHLIKACWLPEVDEAEGIMSLDSSFYQNLIFQTQFNQDSDIYGRDVAELIEESGLSEDEAHEWFTEIQLQSADAFPYRIEIFDNFELFGRDLIQGAYGAEALGVEDGQLNGLQMIKASIDYSSIYDRNSFNDDEWARIEKSLVKNYVYLFNSESEYMICVSGTSDMDILEKIAANIEVYETSLFRNYYYDGLDYIFNDMAKG